MNKRKGPSLYIRMKSKPLRLILKGFKVLKEDGVSRNEFQRYNRYKPFLVFISTAYLFLYVKHNYFNFEFQKFKHPNILIPRIVYKVRKEHYIYWEKSRLARGLPTTFSYYSYDQESVSNLLLTYTGND